MRNHHRAFTIVELLIVIVVIAVLAATTIVAYNGIQNRANDTTVQADLNNFGKYLKLKEVDLGSPPAGGAVRSGGTDTGSSQGFTGIAFRFSRGAYLASVNNVYYCSGVETATGQISFRIYARSKSLETFKYSSNGTVMDIGQVAISSNYCLQEYSNTGSWSYGYEATSGGIWFNWTNG